MPTPEIHSQSFSPLAQSTPIAACGGDYLFISGQTPHDAGTGNLVTRIEQVRDQARDRIDLREFESLFDRIIPGPLAAQAFTILANVEKLLAEKRMGMEHLIKANIYVTDYQNLDALLRIWRIFFPQATVACTIAGISTVGLNDQIRVTMDFIAALPDRIPPETIRRVASDSMHVGFGCAAVRAGDLIFVSGHIGADAKGNAILKCEQLGAQAQALIDSMPLATPRTNATYAQMWHISERITRVLEELGSSGDEVLIANYIAKTMRIDFFDTFPVNKRFFPNVPPAGTGFGYPAVSAIPDINVQVEVIATVRGRKKGFTFSPNLTKPTTHYTMATGSGPYVFLSGRAGINWQKNGDPVVAAEDLAAWEGQHIMVGRLEKEKQVFLQAWYCYAAISRIVEEMGATLDDVVKTNIFVMDLADLPLVERARNFFFKDHFPVETVIPITQCTMHKELIVEVEPIIVMRNS